MPSVIVGSPHAWMGHLAACAIILHASFVMPMCVCMVAVEAGVTAGVWASQTLVDFISSAAVRRSPRPRG